MSEVRERSEANSPLQEVIADVMGLKPINDGGGAQATPASVVLFDADKPQRIPFQFGGRGKNKGKTYAVFLTFAAVADGTYFAYGKQRDVRLSNDAQGALDTSNENFTANVWLGRQLLHTIEGWGPENGSKLEDDRLADVVQQALLACDIQPIEIVPGDALADAPWEDDSAGAEAIRLRCLYAGQLLVTEHTPGEVASEELSRLRKRHQRLMSQAKLVEGEKFGRRETKVPSRSEELCKLYDALGFTSTGYAGCVPPWHKEEIITNFFAVEQEATQGK